MLIHLQSRYRIRHWIPMFMGHPVVKFIWLSFSVNWTHLTLQIFLKSPEYLMWTERNWLYRYFSKVQNIWCELNTSDFTDISQKSKIFDVNLTHLTLQIFLKSLKYFMWTQRIWLYRYFSKVLNVERIKKILMQIFHFQRLLKSKYWNFLNIKQHTNKIFV